MATFFVSRAARSTRAFSAAQRTPESIPP